MERTGFIGGSDAVKIMNGEWYELWEIKTGRKPATDLSSNLVVQLGIHTEDFNLSWFEKEHNCVLKGHQTEYFLNVLDTVPCKGTIDALWGDAIVEAKHTNSFNNMDKVLEFYMPQLQFYMHLAVAEKCYLSVIFGNSKYEAVKVNYDGAYVARMMSAVKEFWQYVVDDQEPIGFDTPVPAQINSIPIDDMVKRDASMDNMFVDAAVTYVNLYQNNIVFENAKKDLKNMIADNEREVYCDYLSLKRDKRGAVRINIRNTKETN